MTPNNAKKMEVGLVFGDILILQKSILLNDNRHLGDWYYEGDSSAMIHNDKWIYSINLDLKCLTAESEDLPFLV